MNKLYAFITWCVILFVLAYFFSDAPRGQSLREVWFLIAIMGVVTAYILGFFFWNKDQKNFAVKWFIAGATVFLFLTLFTLIFPAWL